MERLDLVIRGGTVYDGTGGAGVSADVGVRGDRIVAVGTIAPRGVQELDARGLVVAPGFIDVHSHDDYAVLLEPEMWCSGTTCATSRCWIYRRRSIV